VTEYPDDAGSSGHVLPVWHHDQSRQAIRLRAQGTFKYECDISCQCGIDLGNADQVPCPPPFRSPKKSFPSVDVLGVFEGQNMEFLHLSVNHAASTLRIPLDHRDPFDELLLVRAQEEGLRLLTANRMLARHPLAVRVEELET